MCGIIEDTCEAIWNALAVDYLRPPSSQDDWKRIREGFNRLWNFPNCLGAIYMENILLFRLLIEVVLPSSTTRRHIVLPRS